MTANANATALVNKRVELQKRLGQEGGLEDFIRMAWPLCEPGREYKPNWHIGAICEALQDVTAGRIRKLCINIPPGCMKSRITGLFWPTWSWIRQPSERWGFWSFDERLVNREANDMLELVRSEWFLQRWGDRLIVKDRDPAIGEFWTTQRGLRFCSTTPRGKATGWHFDYQVIDDPTKPATVSKVTLEESLRWWSGTLPTRWADPATGRRVLVMQRLHENDLAGVAEREGYHMLRIPMRYEAKCISIHRDPRRVEGELLWPSRFPEENVFDTERQLGPSQAAAQLQQRPAPEGGAVFRREWFRVWVNSGMPSNHLADGSWKEKPKDLDEIIQSWDCAFKDTDDSDYVCGQVWGRQGADFYLLDEVRERLDFAATCNAIRTVTARWPLARTILVEDKANGSAIITTLKEEFPGIEAVNPEGGKESRANAITGDFAGGHIYHPDPAMFGWVNEHRNELLSFPFGANDDRVDACSQAVIFLAQKFRAFNSSMRKVCDAMAGNKEAASQVERIMDIFANWNGRVL